MPKKILFFILLIILSFNVSLAAQNSHIRLNINDNLVTDNLHYKLAQDDILIPLQTLVNNLPIKMKWYSSIETLSLEYKDKKMKFRLGAKRLQVNNQLMTFSAAPYKSDNQIMVPLKTLGEALGLAIRSKPQEGEVNIYQDHARIMGIENLDQDNDGLKIKVSQQVETKAMFLENPARIVLDLTGTALYDKFFDFKINSPLIEAVRLAQFNGNTVRLVLDLSTKAKYELEKAALDEGYEYNLKVSPLITDLIIEEQKIKLKATSSLTERSIDYLENPQRVVVDLKNVTLAEQKKIRGDNSLFKEVRISQYQTDPFVVRLVIELNKEMKFKTEVREDGLLIEPLQNVLEGISYAAKNRVKIDLNKKVEPKSVFLKSGSRLLIDFPNTRTQLKSRTFDYDSELIEEVRVSQYNQTTTRVVVDLIAPLPHQFRWQGNQLQVSLFNKLRAFNLVETKVGTEARVELLAQADCEVHRLINPRRVVIDIPNVVVNQDEIKVPKPKGVIKGVRVSQYSTNPHQTRVVLDLSRSVNVVRDTVGNSLRFKLADFDLAGKVITVDPGHGGKDPGALGYSDIREKTPALEIALRLEKMLKEAGAKVVMTRRDDRFITLSERTEIANRMDSDIFVSIHLNGHRSSNSFGTETFIAPASPKDTKLLAEFIQSSLVEKLGTFDRGVKEEKLYVLEHTTMPAVLEEVVFISNKKEEDKIMKESFKKKSAGAIYKGIVKYFELLEEEK